MFNFEKTLAAAQAVIAADQNKWRQLFALGDALIEECGAPGDNGVRTGGYERLEEARRMLVKAGIHFKLSYLEDLRRVAANFPAPERSEADPWSAHLFAGTPDNLRAARADAEHHNKRLTVGYVRKFLAQRDAEIAERQKEKDSDRAAPPERARQEALRKFSATIEKCDELIELAFKDIAPYQLNDLERKRLSQELDSLMDRIAGLAENLRGPVREAAE